MNVKIKGSHCDPLMSLRHFLDQIPETRRILIGYSGGLDSHVLLHAAAACRSQRADLDMLALHVDHGMQDKSREWANHCRNICRDLDFPIEVLETNVLVDASVGPEASARIARYSLFAGVMRDGDYILLAQHADDQVETFLLQALRGSGPDGLASIPQKRKFANGWLCRPLLGCAQRDLQLYAEGAALHWVEDPSNNDTSLDRNFLRHEIVPLLRQRWPALNRTLARSAARSGAASRLLLTLAEEDLTLVSDPDEESMIISVLLSIGQDRVFNALRLWVRESGYKMPRLQDLKQVESDLLHARAETAGVVNARDYEFRRFGDRLYLLPPQQAPEAFLYHWQAPFGDLQISEIGLTLTRANCAAQGLVFPDDAKIRVQSRVGGELIRLGSPSFHKAVKKLLQEARIPPWERENIPLIYIDGKLAAVWQVAVSNDYAPESA